MLNYPKIEITASVVIVYFNEEWTAILRTVHSVVNRSPPRLLQEVILLDDNSTRSKAMSNVGIGSPPVCLIP